MRHPAIFSKSLGFAKCFAASLTLLFTSLASGQNLIINPSFESGIGDTAAWWTNIAGPSGSTTGTGGMANTGGSGAYMQADHINNPAAVTPYGIEQFQPTGTIDDSLNYNLSFSAKSDSDDFSSFDMVYQILWLDGDVSHGGGVLGQEYQSLLPAGLNTNFQTFSLNNMNVPIGADSFRLRFELLPGADPDVANGLHIDDVNLEPLGGGSGLPIDPGNLIINPSFESGIGDTAAWWTNIAGPSGSTTGTGGMANTGGSGAYMQADHFNNPPAVTPYGIEQFQPTGTIDDSLNYNLSFSAKSDSDDFSSFDMVYQILWLDGDVSHGGGVLGEEYHSLLPAGLNTNFQTFSLNNMDVPEGADSFRLRFELLPGADPDVANGLHIDDVVLSIVGAPLPGDFNSDGAVGIADYTVWRDNLGGSFDLNGNGNETGGSAGVVDLADYALWVTNFGNSALSPTSAANAVPEPNAAVLLILGSFATYLKRRRDC